MRVIAGEFRSRRLKSLPGLDTRPTPDRLREALFNVLAPVVEGCVFVDAYAGTGAVGIEALSRGAKRVVFLESNRAAVELIEENLRTLGADARAEVVRGKAGLLVGRYGADIVFADPPYELEREYEAVLAQAGDVPLVILQHASRLVLPETSGKLTRTRVLRQGDNSLSFYTP
jgi:16S rRNA (guanine(966)-N(2))-methyltransferase RsmD